MIAMKENVSDQDSNRRSHRYNSHVPHEEDEGASTKTPKKASSTRGDEDAMKTEVDGSGGDDDNDNDAMTTTISTTTTTTFAGPSAEDIPRGKQIVSRRGPTLEDRRTREGHGA